MSRASSKRPAGSYTPRRAGCASPSTAWPGSKPGDSIAVDGVDRGGAIAAMRPRHAFDVMPRPIAARISARCAGQPVNLERSVRSEDRLSGHVVRGVVEGTGELASLVPRRGRDA